MRAVVVIAMLSLTLGGCQPSTPPTPAAPQAQATPSELGADWELGPEAPEALTEVAAAAHDGRIWIAGGYRGDSSWTDAVSVLDPEAGEWTAGPALPETVNHAAMVSTGDELMVLGGYAGPAHAPTSDVWVLAADGERWDAGPELPDPIAAGAAAWDGQRVVFGGGVGQTGPSQRVWALEDGAWQQLDGLGRSREHLAAASDGAGTTWFLGGRESGIDTNMVDVDVVTGERTRRLGSLPTARGGVAGFAWPGIGGCSAGGEGPEGTFHEVECLDDTAGGTTLPPLPEARHGIGAAVLDGTAYVLLGGPEPGLTVSATVQTLDLSGIGPEGG